MKTNKYSSVEWLKHGLALLALLCAISPALAQEPELFMSGKVSTKYKERDLTISAEDNHLLYSIHSYNDETRMIVEILKEGKEWGEPKLVSFSGIYKDIEPMFDPNGKKLYFASNRPLFDGDESQDYNIWYVDKQKNGWGNPMALDTIINTEGDEFFPSVSNRGTLYYTATLEVGKGKEDIYYSLLKDGEYQAPISMDSAINTATYEFNSFIDPDERFIIFSSYKRPDGLGGGDLYIAYQTNGIWQMAQPLGDQINSTKLDYCPFVSADGKIFYFTSNRKQQVGANSIKELRHLMDNPQNGFDDIYTISFDELPKP
ncbi:PD40 domain-containing protein [Reichenbachiella faecimaris]|nr:PD40 domain-containing protein [Reichenbachiella faecimaris]